MATLQASDVGDEGSKKTEAVPTPAVEKSSAPVTPTPEATPGEHEKPSVETSVPATETKGTESGTAESTVAVTSKGEEESEVKAPGLLDRAKEEAEALAQTLEEKLDIGSSEQPASGAADQKEQHPGFLTRLWKKMSFRSGHGKS